MRKVMSNLLRFLLIFAVMVSGCVCAASIAGMVIASSSGMYNSELNEAIRNGRKNLAGLYSRYIFEKMIGQENPGCMENSNMQYVIIKGVNPNEDISSKANTEVINNDNNYNINITIIFVDFICLYIKFSQIFKFYNVNRVRQA